MPNYRRAYAPGGTYFFTVVTWKRRHLLSSEDRIDHLRDAFRYIRARRPFDIDGMVVLPDHLHCIWRLPPGDADYAARWREIKKRFSGVVNPSSNERNERLVWQRRYYEHLIRDETDWRRHMDYLHYNPVKHGLVRRAADWPYSSFRSAVRRGWYAEDWGRSAPQHLDGLELE